MYDAQVRRHAPVVARISEKTNKAYRKLRQIYINVLNFFFGRISSVHRHEAEERYWILWRELETAIFVEAGCLDIPFNGIEKDPYKFDDFYYDLLSQIGEVFKKSAPAEDAGKRIDAKRKLENLLLYAKILSYQRSKITSRVNDLNMLWKDMTFIRSRLLTDEIIPDDKLSSHLEFCRLEVKKLCTAEDADILEISHETAVELVDSENPDPAKSKKTRRNLSFIISRLNDLRLHSINSQFRIKNIYSRALIFLIVLSLFLIASDKIITANSANIGTAGSQFISQFRWLDPISWFLAPFHFCLYYLDNNALCFIFFAGLLGGFFSTIMRLRAKNIDLADVYIRSYLLTKPVVGALGATILYIIILSDIVPIDIDQLKIVSTIQNDNNIFGPTGFAFGFIMGFSERIILPTIKQTQQ